jgi:hypothetical protein
VLPLSKTETTARSVLTSADLFDLRAKNAAAALTTDDASLLSLRAEADTYQGCYIDYASSGEKVLSAARIVGGIVFHSGFTLEVGDGSIQCEPSLGDNVLYADALCDITQVGVSFPPTNLPPYNPPPIFIQDGKLKLITSGGVEDIPELPIVPGEEAPPCDPATETCECDPAVQQCGGEAENLPFDAVIKAQSAYREDN